MRLTYDLNIAALYIRLSDHAIARTREVGDNAAVDLDAASNVVGVEVISVAHPWPLAEILATYPIPENEQAQLRAYFGTPRLEGDPLQEAPMLSIASPAPAKAAA